MKYTINQFRKEYPNDDVCLDTIFKLRYSAMPCCPACSQETTFKRIAGRRCYQCSDKDCQYQLYPTAGTVFEKTRVSLVNWFYVIYLMTSTRNGVSGKEIQRQLGVTYKCAWRMGHQIRLLMANGTDLLSGVVEADEVFIGGKNKNMHKTKRDKMNANGTGTINKIPVLAVMERGGNIRTRVLNHNKDANMATMLPMIRENVVAGSVLITDGHGAYRALAGEYQHEVVGHDKEEYVRGIFHTNSIEGFFSHLKRTIGGTHIHVSKTHLQKYVDECSFRYVHRKEGQMMFKTILGRVVS
ncbi:MAG: IS1595 family transposase [Mucilaginibacter sp.]